MNEKIDNGEEWVEHFEEWVEHFSEELIAENMREWYTKMRRVEHFSEELIARFRRWLKEQDIDEVAALVSDEKRGTEPCEPDESGEHIDLFTLFSELAALKQETRIASRQWKAGTDQWERITSILREALDALKQEQGQRRKDVADVKGSLLRPLMQGIFEIRDRMEQGIKAAEKAHSSWLSQILIAGGEAGKKELVEGQKMTLRHLDRLLDSYGICPVDAAGKIFDPFTMRAVEVERRDDLPNGFVIEEIRRGFLLNEEILRTADVKVNKFY